MTWDQRVPFAEDGSLVTYVFRGATEGLVAGSGVFRGDSDRQVAWSGHVPVIWKDIFTFDATLTLDGMIGGYGEARFLWVDGDGRRYEMFMADMLGLITSGTTIQDGSCRATWTFTKKGLNYGVRAVTDA